MKRLQLLTSMIALAATTSTATAQVAGSSVCQTAGLQRGKTYQIEKMFGEPFNAPVNRPYLAGDGKSFVFVSAATNITATTPTGQAVTPNGFAQVYVTDLTTLLTVMVSVDANGQPSDADCTLNEGAINYDGSIAIMECTGSNLSGTSDTNAASDVFAAFLEPKYGYSTGDLVLASKSISGTTSSGSSTVASIAAKAPIIVFSSNGVDLVEGFVPGASSGPGGATQNYIFDLSTGEVTLLSVDANGNSADGFVATAALDAAGSLVVTPSAASNLEEDIYDNRGFGQFFNLFSFTLDGSAPLQVTNTPLGTPQSAPPAYCGRPRESVAFGSICGNQSPNLSYDGRYLVFDTTTGNFEGTSTVDYNGTTDVYWKDLWTGEIRLVSRAPNTSRAVSNPGRFGSSEPEEETTSTQRSRRGGSRTTRRTPTRTPRRGGSDSSVPPLSDAAELSGDGRFVIFRSSNPELTMGIGGTGVFLADTSNFAATPVRVSIPPAGLIPSPQTAGNAAQLAQSDMPNLSEFGNIAAFESTFTDPEAPGSAALTGYLRCMF